MGEKHTGTEKVEIGVCFQGWVKIFIVIVIFLCLTEHFLMFLAHSYPVAEPRCNERNRTLKKHRRQHLENSSTLQPKSMCHVG